MPKAVVGCRGLRLAERLTLSKIIATLPCPPCSISAEVMKTFLEYGLHVIDSLRRRIVEFSGCFSIRSGIKDCIQWKVPLGIDFLCAERNESSFLSIFFCLQVQRKYHARIRY